MALALVLASGRALAVNEIGTNSADTLRGTGGADNLLGRGGNEVRPQGGDKNLLGGPGNDAVLGGNGSDNPLGGSGNDDVSGGRGADSVLGGGGPDWHVDGPLSDTARDALSGGDGNDAFIVNNLPATRDIISCGGLDRVAADSKDQAASDCERVRRGRDAELELAGMFEELGFFAVFEGLAPSPFD
jgi:Ca2+-binding RTX toxin-like protein